ncbi:MAG: hypothetical protein WCW31_05105 [Patescibacteria group bacterium]|jgi:hypothetical protein
MTSEEETIIRTLAFHAAWGYAPTRIQLLNALDQGESDQILEKAEISEALSSLLSNKIISEETGRLSLLKFADQIQSGREKEISFPRKLKKARKVARFLGMLPWVRAIFLCNTAALGQTADKGDLDFFIIARQGAIWRTRLASVLPFMLMGDRPGAKNVVDPVCLSFFVSDSDLDLSSRMLEQDDPYFRFWFLYLLPLKEDGALQELWNANSSILRRHPFAKQWLALDTDYPSQLAIRHSPFAKSTSEKRKAKSCVADSWSESFARKVQEKMFPEQIKSRANLDTSVMVDGYTLKFHVKDNRRMFKNKYYEICKEYEVKP